jgi:catechol 2,3-dioxygenase-like lactoylglutathione lyase family enzyme
LGGVFDHVAIEVADLARSRAFYELTLAPLGVEVVSEPVPHMVGIGSEGKPWFWLMGRGRPEARGVHLAFQASDRDAVDTFHAAGLAAGGTDNGAPGPRPLYHSSYYAAFVRDPDGNNVEAVCHAPID